MRIGNSAYNALFTIDGVNYFLQYVSRSTAPAIRYFVMSYPTALFSGITCPIGSLRNMRAPTLAMRHLLASERIVFEYNRMYTEWMTVNYDMNVTVSYAQQSQQFSMTSTNASRNGITVQVVDQDVQPSNYGDYLLMPQRIPAFAAFTSTSIYQTAMISASMFASLNNLEPFAFYNATNFCGNAKGNGGLETSIASVYRGNYLLNSLRGYANRLVPAMSRIQYVNQVLKLYYANIGTAALRITVNAIAFKEPMIGNAQLVFIANTTAYFENHGMIQVSFANSGTMEGTFNVTVHCVHASTNATVHWVILSNQSMQVLVQANESTIMTAHVQTSAQHSINLTCTASIQVVNSLPLWSSQSKQGQLISSVIPIDHGYFVPQCAAAREEAYLIVSKSLWQSDSNALASIANPYQVRIANPWQRISNLQTSGNLTLINSGAVGALFNLNASCMGATMALNNHTLYLESYATNTIAFTIQYPTNSGLENATLSCFVHVTIVANSICWSVLGKSYNYSFTLANMTVESCPPGFTGSTCSTPICYSHISTNACSQHGTCTAPNECSCDNGYSGLECSFASCFMINATNTAQVCNGHGTCQALDSCACQQGYSGLNCSFVSCFGYVLKQFTLYF